MGIGYSPAQILFGRNLKDALPNHPANLRYKAVTMDYTNKYGVEPSKHCEYILQGMASKKLIKSQETYDEH